tara:strand:- start:200 stop:475 length:276 start_codon:yes stop_codon:yes gene_type:complete
VSQAVKYFKTTAVKQEILSNCKRFLSNAKLNENTQISANSFLYLAQLYQDQSLVKALLEFTNLYVDFSNPTWEFEVNHLESYNALRFFAKV